MLSKEGQIYLVTKDYIFKSGSIVVALDDKSEWPCCILYVDYKMERPEKLDYNNDDYWSIPMDNLKEISLDSKEQAIGYVLKELDERKNKLIKDLETIFEGMESEIISVGDDVKVIDSDMAYPIYDNWMIRNISDPSLLIKWSRGFKPENGDVGKVVAIHPYGMYDKYLPVACVVSDDGSNVYIINVDGIKKI